MSMKFKKKEFKAAMDSCGKLMFKTTNGALINVEGVGRGNYIQIKIDGYYFNREALRETAILLLQMAGEIPHKHV